MTAETAQWVFYSVAIPMALVWLLGTWYAFSTVRRWTSSDGERGLRGEDDDGEPELRGEVLLDGESEALSKKIAEQLVVASLVQRGASIRITGRTADRVTFEVASRKSFAASAGGSLTLAQEGSRVRARLSMRLAGLRAFQRRVTTVVCFVWGGLFVVGVPVLVWVLALGSENPIERFQVLQTLQMAHGVWPPFLLGWLWSRMRRTAHRTLEDYLANLRHVT